MLLAFQYRDFRKKKKLISDASYRALVFVEIFSGLNVCNWTLLQKSIFVHLFRTSVFVFFFSLSSLLICPLSIFVLSHIFLCFWMMDVSKCAWRMWSDASSSGRLDIFNMYVEGWASGMSSGQKLLVTI